MSSSPLHRITTGAARLVTMARYVASGGVTQLLNRAPTRWVFGSGRTIDPDLLTVARQVGADSPRARITWLTAAGDAHAPADLHDFPVAVRAVPRDSLRGFLETARAGHILTTHGLADVNRRAVFRGRVVQIACGGQIAAGHHASATSAPDSQPVPGSFSQLDFTQPDVVEPFGPSLLRRIARKLNTLHHDQRALVIVPDAQTAATARATVPDSPGRVTIVDDPPTDVLGEIARLKAPDAALVRPGGVFFESFDGRHVTCNPLALDREIAHRYPDLPRYWSVISEEQAVPAGARAVVVGGAEWLAARRAARLLIVNDWLRFRFTNRGDQFVLQTWHGTMLKALALAKPDLGFRSRKAVRAESSRWSMMLSQNSHSTQQFRESYAFSGPILETGYPRDDELVRALDTTASEPRPTRTASAQACAALGVDPDTRVMAYVPTWRYSGEAPDELLNLTAFADDLGSEWTIVVRGHTRVTGGTTNPTAASPGANTDATDTGATIVDASAYPNVNTVFLAADLLVTDFSSVMFDAALTGVPMLFFAPDSAEYGRGRGFTFDFPAAAPGPILDSADHLLEHVRALGRDGRNAAWVRESAPRAQAWRERFLPHDDGHAAARVVDELAARGLLG